MTLGWRAKALFIIKLLVQAKAVRSGRGLSKERSLELPELSFWAEIHNFDQNSEIIMLFCTCVARQMIWTLISGIKKRE